MIYPNKNGITGQKEDRVSVTIMLFLDNTEQICITGSKIRKITGQAK
jgi:hypothetical protein